MTDSPQEEEKLPLGSYLYRKPHGGTLVVHDNFRRHRYGN